MRRAAIALAVSVVATLLFAALAQAASPQWQITAVSSPTNLPPAQKEVQEVRVYATGGTFALAFATVEATGNWSPGSPTVSQLSTTYGAFHVGQAVTGPGIPAGTTVTALGPGTLTLSASPTSSKEPGVLRVLETTSQLPFNAATSQVKTALEALPAIGGVGGKLVVSGGPGGAGAEHPYRVTFQGSLAFTDLLQMSADASALIGGDEEAIVATATQGGSGQGVIRVAATNVGDAATAGTVSVAGSISNGVSATSITGENAFTFTDAGHNTHASIPCALATLTCSISEPLLPGDTLLVEIGVSVPSSAPSSITAQASVSGGGAPQATASQIFAISTARAPFGIAPGSYFVAPSSTQAGARANLTTSFAFDTETGPSGPITAGSLKDVEVALPPGLIGNPTAVERCSASDFYLHRCSAKSIVGVATLLINQNGSIEFPVLPIYDLLPPKGKVVDLAFEAIQGKVWTHVFANVRTGSDYGVTVAVTETPQLANVLLSSVSVWGVPADLSGPGPAGFSGFAGAGAFGASNPSATRTPFFSNPTSCGGGTLSTGLSIDSWQQAGTFLPYSATSPAITGCNGLDFAPSIKSKPTTNATDSPSGLEFDLHIPQNEEPEGRATANLKGATVVLPEGVAVNPASANGLEGCSSAQIGLTSPPGKAPATYTPAAAHCPDAAKIGTVEVDTPLLDHPLPGAVYVATPSDNPFGSLLAIYITIDDPETGVVVKLAGEVKADPQTGRLTTGFEENPQVPFEDFKLDFFGGASAALRTPPTCGEYTTESRMTPWSTPEGADSLPTDSFQLIQGAGGSPCASSRSQQPNAPSFEAGTQSPLAGAYSPFVLHLARQDGSQEIKQIDTTLPAGLVARLAGVSECSDAQIVQAEHRNQLGQGALERSTPSCPAASEVGVVQVGAGAGPTPLYVTGKAYLAGPYKGAPLSLAIITPAVAGPFDLGTVVVRTALYVSTETAQIHAVSDPIPTILEGIPLDVRSITLKMARPNFTLNPTNCEELGFSGNALSVFNQSAPLSQRFQVGGCSALRFKPKLSLALKGSTKRAGTPAFTATLTMKPGEANIAAAQVTLPHAEFLDNAHIKTVCTKVQLAANACPAGSIYGFAKATTPLLDHPLEGPVYLGTGYGHELPDLLADLNGQIHVILNGIVDTGKGGGLRNTFEVVPDAPVSKFVLSMKGGKKGLLENSENLCASPHRAIADFTAQSGAVSDTEPLLKVKCAKKGRKGHHRHHKAG